MRLGLGQLGLHDRLESPMFASLGKVLFTLQHGRRFAGAGIGGSHAHPILEIREDRVRHFIFRRHLQVRVSEPHGLDDQRPIRLARDKTGAGRSALEQASLGVQL